ncbi:Formin-like 3 [Ectocarpus siliculosus]|uniref:Formin-like 3 n=1 Tax=Ectocarpus siliculosus TaxID=2880 RepID=D8LKU4_ECTSI|nr:Formin-like 3 [Ectocarpus siliculosus]|eukprot:CBN80077.1 Formin-like 3 [Ectocarpus siliculosus]
MAACNRRGRKAEAHRRWESVSSTIDIPCGVVLNDLPHAAVKSVAPSFQNKPSSSTSSEALAARATPPARQQDGHPGGDDDGSSGVNSGGVGVAGPAHEQTSGGGTMWEDDGDDDDKEVYIPTEDLGVFMATLMDGMRSDGVQLAQSAKSVVANTYQVVVRPWEAVTRMAAPFLPTNPPHIQPSRENTRRGHELLDNALAFRMPGAFGSARPRQPGVADDRVGAGNGGGGALRTIDGNSPPRSTPPSSPSRGRSSRAAVAGGGGGGDARAAGVRKRGRGAQRGRLGAVKLDATPPKDGGSGGSRSGCELPSAAVEPAAATTAPLRSCSPSASPLQECGMGGGLLRRLSLSKSPPRRGLSFKNVLPFGGGGGGGGGGGETGSSTHRCRAVAKPAAAAGVGGERAGTGAAPRRPAAVVTEGSRIDLRGLDRAKGGNNPRAYRCKDGSIVVLGRERMLSVLPDGSSSGAESGSGIDGGNGGGGGAGSSGLVTWVLRYTELESCSINVSAGKESEHAVGDVVVEVTTRPKTEASGTGSKAASTTNKPGRRSFCLTNPSDCLELLRSIQLRWQPSSSPPSSSPASSSSSASGAAGKEKPLAMDSAVLGDSTPSRVGDSGGTGDACWGKAGGEGGGGHDDNGAGDNNSSSLGAVTPLRELREGFAAGGSGGGAGGGVVSPSSPPPPRREASVVLSPPGSKSEAGSVASSPFSGVKRGVIILESPAKVLRDQLKERHEQHERGLKEDLEQRRKSSKASLMRRRELRRRSVSQSPCRSGCGGLNTRGFDPSPLQMPPSKLPDGAAAPEVETAGSKQPSLSKYKNMKKAGLPDGAIRQKMTMDDMASYVGLVLDPASSSAIPAAAMPPPPARAGSAAALGSAAAQPSPAVPKTPPAAAAATVANATTPSPGGIPPPPPLPLSSKIPPPPPPMPGMLTVPPPLPVALGRGCSDKSLLGPGLRPRSGPPCSPLDSISSCRSEGGGFFGGRAGGSVPPPAPTPTLRRTSKPLLNFHWDVLPPAKIERTVWAKRRTAAAAAAAMVGGGREACGSPRTTLSVDDAEVEELEKLFSKKTAKAAASAAAAGQGGRRVTLGAGTGGPGLGGAAVEGKGLGGSSGGGRGGGVGRGGGGGAGGRVKKVSLLDVNRGNNVAIGLKAFRRVGDVSELARLVSGLDPKEVLTTEDLQRLEGCLPTAQELRTVMAFSGPAAALGSAETFFRALRDTPRPASKVSAVLFSRQFLGSVAGDAESRVETLRMACEEAMESDRLAAVLEKVLDIGNLLNEGTYQGNACGFRISSLLKLSHTKSHSDKKTTVLHYMVRTFAAKERAAAAAASPPASGKTLKSKTPPRSSAEKQRSAAWPGGAPPGCRGSGMSGGGTRASGVRREVSGTSSGAASPGAGASQRGAVTPARGGSAVRANSGYLLRAGGKRRGSPAAAVQLTRVEALDLESELKHVRQASKTPVGEIMIDVRQARKGLRQAKEELDRTLVEEEKKKEETKGVGASAAGGGAAKAAASRPSDVSERSCSSSLSPAARGSSSSSLSREGEIEGGSSAGVRKLAAFVEEAEARLSSIEQRARACIGLCKGLGEFFGEGDDEAQSAHILRTLVDFMDLLEEAKKVEGLC